MKDIGIGLIGAGNIAQFHMQGYNSVREAYGEVNPRFVVVADLIEERAQSIALRYNFEKVTADWNDVINDPAVDCVLITTPNYVHAEMAIAAAKAGKHVMCEKPMAMDKAEGQAMVDAVKAAGVVSQVDFIYRKCPATEEAKKMIDSGALGDIITFRGWFDAAYKADPASPMEWRQYEKYAGTGALGDITAHVISLSDYLVNGQLGGIDEVCAVWDIAIPERTSMDDPAKIDKVDTDDLNYVLVRYQNGRIGTMYASRVATGHDCRMGYEIHGTKGTVKFNVERLNELELFLEDGDKQKRGFKTLSPNTAHGDYRHYSIYDDMGISYSNVMGIQAQSFLRAVAGGGTVDTDIAYGYYVDRVMEAMQKSIAERRWVKISEV